MKAWKESHCVSHPAHLHTPWLYSGWLGLASPFRPELCSQSVVTSASNEGYPKVRNHGEGPY